MSKTIENDQAGGQGAGLRAAVVATLLFLSLVPAPRSVAAERQGAAPTAVSGPTGTGQAPAQPGTPGAPFGAEELSLEAAVALALERNPDVLKAREGLRAAEGQRLQAEARPDPDLILDTAGLPLGFKRPDGLETEYALGLEQLLEYPGKRSTRGRIGRAVEDAARLELERAVRLARAAVERAYIRAVAADARKELLGDSLRLLDGFIEVVRARYESGTVPYGDLLRARVERARLENRLVEEDRARDAALAELNILIGRLPGAPAKLTTPLDVEKTSLEDLESVRSGILAGSASLKLAAVRVEQAGAEVRLAELARRPDLRLGLYAPSKRIGGWGLSLGLSLPLSPKRKEGALIETTALRDVTRTAREAAEIIVSNRVSQVLSALRSLAKQLEVFEAGLLADAMNELDIALEYYRLGKAEAYLLIDLHRTLTETRLEHAQARSLYRLALIDLEVAGEEVLI